MGRTACTEPQCLYKGALYLFPLISIYANAMFKVKARKMAAHLSLAYQQDGRCGTSSFTSLLFLTGQMNYELVLQRFPLQYNAVVGVNVHWL